MLSLFAELKRRNVFRVAVAYLALAWLVTEVAGTLFPAFGIPDWGVRFVVIVFALGFLPALIISWVYELTPEGIKREKDVVRDVSITHLTAKRLDVFTIGLIVVAIAFILFDRMWLAPRLERAPAPDAAAEIGSVQTAVSESGAPQYSSNSIAVLPFANRSANPDDVFFVDGIHDDLLTYISQIGSIKTISRTSVMQYRGSPKPIPEIARELGVRTVLEGGVQRAGEQVRINVQLIDAQTDNHLWSQIYDRELTAENVFSIQSEIAGSIADALRATLTPENRERMKRVPTQNLAALEAYYLGRQQMGKRTVESLARAVDHFSDAVSHDPDFALAHVGLADTYWLQVVYSNLPSGEMLARSRASVEKALELDPMLGEVQTALANVRKMEDDIEGAEAAFQRALELNPNYALAYQWYGEMLGFRTDRLTEALELSQKAVSLDPLAPIIRNDYARILQRAGRFDEALAQLQKAIEIDPGFAYSYRLLALLYRSAYGRLDKAISSWQKSHSIEPYHWFLSSMAEAYMELGGTQEAEFWSQRAVELSEQEYRVNQTMALLQLYRGEQASSLVFAGKALANRPRWGWALTLVTIHDLKAGNFDGARARYEEIYPELFAGAEPEINRQNFRAAVRLAEVLIGTGEQEKAEQLLDRTLSYISTIPRLGSYGYGTTDILIHALRGDKEKALAALRQAINQGWRQFWWINLEHDPILQPLHGEPEFQAMKEEIEADMAEQLARVRERVANVDLIPEERASIKSQ